MKKLFIMVLAAFMALTFSSCNKDEANTPDLPIKNLELPQSSADVPLKSGEPVVIKGSGFTKDCQIWLSAGTKSPAVQATIIEITESRIVFSAKAPSGEYDITLKQAEKEFNLGKANFRVIKRVKTITPENIIGGNFVYDEQGRLTNIDDVKTTYEYPEGKIILTYNKGAEYEKFYEYVLDKGIIVSMSNGFKKGEQPTRTYAYRYSSDYNLIGIGENQKYTWENGNMVKYEQTSSESNGPTRKYTRTLKYNEHLNYTTFDPTDLLDTKLGFVGNTIKNLVSENASESIYGDDKYTSKMTYEYEFDKDNYPIKATVMITDNDGNTKLEGIYTVTYY